MEPFQNFESKVVPFPYVNVDTDQIIPKQFLKLTQKIGFGKYLFYDWRYNKNGEPKKDFILNNPTYSGYPILLTLDNFGSGSSREHAVWAILDYGFRVIISPSFADIFYSNCIKNGILPIILEKKEIEYLFDNPDCIIKVDLNKQQIELKPSSRQLKFQIDPSKKKMLLEGLDEIGMTLQLESHISDYENKVHNDFNINVLPKSKLI
ncbi:MAG TPA: 3-isopropylmalate dehydratase small subunit [Nitrososphaeraceae archaeon]|nr:3-isopropylmalate dehydratase small subunit [Nitrososphaeraceae archaeon]